MFYDYTTIVPSSSKHCIHSANNHHPEINFMCPNFDAITNHIDGETANYMDIAQSHVSECRIHAEPAMNANASSL